MHPLHQFCLEACSDATSPDACSSWIRLFGKVVVLTGHGKGECVVGEGAEPFAGCLVGFTFYCGVEELGCK